MARSLIGSDKRSTFLVAAIAIVLIAASLLAARWWLHDERAASENDHQYDLAQISARTALYAQRPCPPPEETFTLAFFGQSTAANSTGQRIVTNDDEAILQRYEGKCYHARDPILGATGEGGSIAIPIARRIDTDRIVVIENYAVHASRARDWLKSAPLVEHRKNLISRIRGADPKHTTLIWIQGEADYSTDPAVYRNELTALLTEIRGALPETPIGMTGTSLCGNMGNPQIVDVQREVASQIPVIFLGSTDAFSAIEDRHDGCHLSASGALKVADLIADGVNAHLTDR